MFSELHQNLLMIEDGSPQKRRAGHGLKVALF